MCQERLWSGTAGGDSGSGHGWPHAWFWHCVTVSHGHTFMQTIFVYSCYCNYFLPGSAPWLALSNVLTLASRQRQLQRFSARFRPQYDKRWVCVLCLQFICCSQLLVKVFWKCSSCCPVDNIWKVNLVLRPTFALMHEQLQSTGARGRTFMYNSELIIW